MATSLFLSLSKAGVEVEEKSYAVICDAGSTGSRVFIFEFTRTVSGDRHVEPINSVKLTPGISSFASHPQDVVEYFRPNLIEIANMLPGWMIVLTPHKTLFHSIFVLLCSVVIFIRIFVVLLLTILFFICLIGWFVDGFGFVEVFRNQTKLYVKATAGMRLITREQEENIWSTLFKGLKFDPEIPFIIDGSNFGTIDGYSEGFYAVLASNFIANRIDGNLHPIEGAELLGALDMGGSSTQLIYMEKDPVLGEPVVKNDFWLHSWLNFGVDKMRSKVEDRVIEKFVVERRTSIEQVEINVEGEVSIATSDLNDTTDESKDGEVVQIKNPCAFTGFDEVKEYNGSTYKLIGTGEGINCVKYIKSVMWDEKDKKKRRW